MAVKVFYVAVLYKGSSETTTLKSASDLTSFDVAQRNCVLDFMTFAGKTVVERTEPGTQCSVKEKEYVCHAYVRVDNLAGVLISDHEYPQREAHVLVKKVLDDFAAAVPSNEWPSISHDSAAFGGLEDQLARFQDPKYADALAKLEAGIDETNIIMHHNVQSVLKRGENLDDLVMQCKQLDGSAKEFADKISSLSRSRSEESNSQWCPVL